MFGSLVESEKSKCCKYWPEKEEGIMSFELTPLSKLEVAANEVEEKGSYVVRRFRLVHRVDRTSSEREVEQFHFKNWPDHKCPDLDEFAEFLSAMQQSSQKKNTPVIVHCSAGVGRTGTLIVADSITRNITRQSLLDPIGAILYMRQFRQNQVQNKIQLKFLYDFLSNFITKERRAD
ncbi:hypothetical protein Ciccas_014487 [Cichlidogyrus casuarinus]|uniref:Uncharacterized protein n=1 Tax=Cichlidogyrus casuarinus TaxID=1844966 RepID=A0ABD2PIS5_9PLAT